LPPFQAELFLEVVPADERADELARAGMAPFKGKGK
jgi:hypothetical protein